MSLWDRSRHAASDFCGGWVDDDSFGITTDRGDGLKHANHSHRGSEKSTSIAGASRLKIIDVTVPLKTSPDEIVGSPA